MDLPLPRRIAERWEYGEGLTDINEAAMVSAVSPGKVAPLGGSSYHKGSLSDFMQTPTSLSAGRPGSKAGSANTSPYKGVSFEENTPISQSSDREFANSVRRVSSASRLENR